VPAIFSDASARFDLIGVNPRKNRAVAGCGHGVRGERAPVREGRSCGFGDPDRARVPAGRDRRWASEARVCVRLRRDTCRREREGDMA